MSNLLWRAYLEDDVEKFRSLLGNGAQALQHSVKGYGGATGSFGGVAGSPGPGYSTSPRSTGKAKKFSGFPGIAGGSKGQTSALTRSDINSRDVAGLTILHRAVSSTSENAAQMAMALIEHPLIDLYLQDRENGWTALHRALYFGNVSIARAMLQKESDDTYRQTLGKAAHKDLSLVRIKDFEGNSAFDVYNATIARRTIWQRKYGEVPSRIEVSDDTDDEDLPPGMRWKPSDFTPDDPPIDGDEFYAFGSNKNLTLGFGDEDDRQHPEKITLKRPDHLLFRLYREDLESKLNAYGTHGDATKHAVPTSTSELPTLIRNKPIVIQDAALSKLHSAILTTDPESNLYMCGFGPGGRLGTGDELTRFSYVCVEGGALEGKKITAVALGQNHSLAVTAEGEIMTWGTNTWGALGYTLPRPTNDKEPVNSTPRQIFGPLKKEHIIGVAASAVHSVAHTGNSLYTWGKNEGQLGLMDSDSRSLEAQTVPRKVAASLFTSDIQMVSAVNRATICLLKNHTVCVFTNYGYNIVKFPLYGGFSNYHLKSNALTTRYEAEPSHISMVTAGGDTIATVSSRGDLFTLNINQKLDNTSASSTTNPSKIKSSLSQPQRIWSLRKGNWDGVRSVSVGENGTVILCTKAGAVWRRVKRPKVKEAFSSENKNKDFKFQRVPGLTNVVAVRSNIFGGYAAIRKDSDVMHQISVGEQTLWEDIAPLFSLIDLGFSSETVPDTTNFEARYRARTLLDAHLDAIRKAVIGSKDLEGDVSDHIRHKQLSDDCDVQVYVSYSDTYIPAHSFILGARSSVLREALCKAQDLGEFFLPEVLKISTEDNFLRLEFLGLEFGTILNLLLYMYTDTIVDAWQVTRQSKNTTYRYRQVRAELMKLAAKLNMSHLETASRLLSKPERELDADFSSALTDSSFFKHADAIVELDGEERRVHSAIMRRRCPFFEGLFGGRASGRWLADRREDTEPVRIDLSHVEPSIFDLVLKYIYSDVGIDMFDDVVVSDIDEFSNLVMDVMAVADELMLNRLSEICQQVLGRFVNTRNICYLLNEIAQFSVAEFREIGLEYICLQLETMLDHHLLDDLQEDLQLELDRIVRSNQLAQLPFAKSGRATLLLHERHPSLAGDLDEEKQRLLRDMTFRLSLRDEDNRNPNSYRIRVGSLDDNMASPSQGKLSRKIRPSQHMPSSPSVRPNETAPELMFDMEDDDSSMLDNASPRSITAPPVATRSGSATPVNTGRNKGKGPMAEGSFGSPSSPLPASFASSRATHAPGKPWSSPVLSSEKLDMRSIMSKTPANRKSSLSMEIKAQQEKEAATRAAAPKMSQKERKKQQQLALQQVLESEQPDEDKRASGPWQVATGHRINLRDVVKAEVRAPPEPKVAQTAAKVVAKAPSLQVPAVARAQNTPRPRAASPDTRFSGQRKTSTGSSSSPAAATHPSPKPTAPRSISSPLVPHSKTYMTSSPFAEPSLQLSMADIIGQQRLEQDLIKEAVAKRSLQEIQEEQAFQEWWDLESRRVREEEEMRAAAASGGKKDKDAAKKANPYRGRGGKRTSRGGGGKGIAAAGAGTAGDFAGGRGGSIATNPSGRRGRGGKM